MKKKEVKNHIEGVIGKLKTLRENKINDDQKTIIDEIISVIQDEAKKLDEMEEDVDNETLAKQILDKVDEKFQAYMEKDTAEEAENLNRMKAENYLSSAQATSDFLNAIRMSENTKAFRQNWGAKLSENGVTGDLKMPEAVHTAIQDAWERKSNWLNRLNNTGAKKIVAGINESQQDALTSRAKGHTAGEQKEEVQLTLNTIDISAQFIYTIIKINNESIWADDGALLNYITNTLFEIWRREVCRAILVGDGRLDSKHIKSVVSVAREESDKFVQVTTHDPNKKYTDEIMDMVDFINNEDGEEILLFMKKKTFTALRRFVLSQGGDPQYITKQTIEEMLGVSEIITTSVIGDDYDIIAFMPKHYTTVGEINPQMASWEEYTTNERGYRLENPFGGAPNTHHFGAVLKSALPA